jgi:hypothetical protein
MASPDYIIIQVSWTPAPPKHIQKMPCAVCHSEWAVFGSIRCCRHARHCATCSGSVQYDTQLVCADCHSLGKLLLAKKPAIQTEAAWEAKNLEECSSSNLSSPTNPSSPHTVIGFR